MLKKIFIKNLSTLAILLVFLLTLFFKVNAQTTQTTCPTGAGVSYDQYEACIINQAGLNVVSGNNFFPKFTVDDIIGIGSTLLLAILVILLTIKIILAGFKWAGDKGEDKAKKEAIKSITNGIIGLFISFGAYFVIIFLRGVLNINGQLIQCGDNFASTDTTFTANLAAMILSNKNALTQDFVRCMDLNGKSSILNDKAKMTSFSQTFINDCKKYYGNNAYGLTITDRKSLSSCFADVINKQ